MLRVRALFCFQIKEFITFVKNDSGMPRNHRIEEEANNMKRVVSLVLIGVFVLTILAGCSSGEKTTSRRWRQSDDQWTIGTARSHSQGGVESGCRSHRR